MRNLSVFILVLGVVFSFPIYSQIQTGEMPPSFLSKIKQGAAANYTVQLAEPGLTSIIAEDIVEDELKDFGWRFGTVVSSNLDLNNSGIWSHDDNQGVSTWKLRVSFQQALSINLNFNQFNLSPNAQLFIYNDNFTDVLGALTSKNNKEDGQFSIRPMRGNSITLELIIPQDESENNTISIHEVIYGYRSIHEKVQKIFQSSANCNINVNCSEGSNWQDAKRSVAMVTSAQNTRFCTGTLINNVRQDSTPYFLGAAHCVIRNNSVFIFGYESAQCNPNTDGSLNNSISGSSRKAITVNFGSDFELRELSSRPPSSYNVYYAGWNNQNVASTKSVGIHHPSGDVMKICVDTDPVVNSGYYSSGTTHWEVQNWEKGTTEGGSSGSALFDANHRIIGQLHGGDAACGNRSQDYYGKFSHSWNSSSDTLRQLKHWLDPDNTGAIVLDGMDPKPAALNLDLATLQIDGIPAFECAQTSTPTFRIKNIGNSTVDSFYVDVELNGSLIQTFSYTTQLKRQGIAIITPPAIVPLNGANTLKITTRIAGGLIDQNLSNNSDSIDFDVSTAINQELQITLKTDNYGSETSWELVDLTTNKQVLSSPGYPDVSGGFTYIDTLCIYDGCFRFNIFDSQSDGFNDPTGNFGNGFLLVTKNGTDTLFFENNFTTTLSTDTFCTRFTTGLVNEVFTQDEIFIFPNPVAAGEILKTSGQTNLLRLRNTTGQLILDALGNEIQLPSNLTTGIYFLEIRTVNSKLVDIKKVIVK